MCITVYEQINILHDEHPNDLVQPVHLLHDVLVQPVHLLHDDDFIDACKSFY